MSKPVTTTSFVLFDFKNLSLQTIFYKS